MRVKVLKTSDRSELIAFLCEKPLLNLFTLNICEKGFKNSINEFIGVKDGSDLIGVVFTSKGGFASLYSPSLDAAAILGETQRSRLPSVVLGPRDQVDVFWRAARGPKPRISYNQCQYVCNSIISGPVASGLRLARIDEQSILSKFSSAMMLEDLGFDPAKTSPIGHKLSIANHIKENLTWVVEQEGNLIFKVDIGSQIPKYGVALGGTYVSLDARNKGVCSSAMRGIVQILLRSFPAVALHLNEANTPAVKCYESVGFHKSDALRLILVN